MQRELVRVAQLSPSVLLTEQRDHGCGQLRKCGLLIGCDPARSGLAEHRTQRRYLRA
jgi:hypothetical protein